MLVHNTPFTTHPSPVRAQHACRHTSFLLLVHNTPATTHPSPVRAQHACICHLCFFILVRLSKFDISVAVMEPVTSCLLAYTRTAALDSSSWARRRYSSSLVSVRRSRSVESTTNTINCGTPQTSLYSAFYHCRHYIGAPTVSTPQTVKH